MTDLVDAWERWDAKARRPPYRPQADWLKREANDLEDACQRVAATLGITASVLRVRVTGHIADGRSIPAAIDRAVSDG